MDSIFSYILEGLFVYLGAVIRIFLRRGVRGINKDEINESIREQWISNFFISVLFWITISQQNWDHE